MNPLNFGHVILLAVVSLMIGCLLPYTGDDSGIINILIGDDINLTLVNEFKYFKEFGTEEFKEKVLNEFAIKYKETINQHEESHKEVMDKLFESFKEDIKKINKD